MSLPTPTTQELSTNIVGQLEASLSQTVPLFPKAFIRVLAKVLAGVLVLLYKYAGAIFLSLFVAYASMKETEVNGKKIRPLVELGRLFGVGDPEPPSRAELIVNVTVQTQTGTLAGGSQILRAESGVIYQVVSAVPLDASVVQATIIASGDQLGDEGPQGAGAIGNLAVGDTLEFVNPLPNVARAVTVAAIQVVGADGETVDQYRARVTRRIQSKPQGGAYADYRQWGDEVPGVANIYVYRGQPGQVDVFVEADAKIEPDGIALPALLTAVDASIQFAVDGLASRRPVLAAVNLLSIARGEFDVTVGGLTAPELGATQAAIKQGVDQYLRSREPFIVGLSVLPRRDSITQGAIGGVVNSIANANGGTVSNVVLKRGGFPVNAYTLGKGEKAKLSATGVTYE